MTQASKEEGFCKMQEEQRSESYSGKQEGLQAYPPALEYVG